MKRKYDAYKKATGLSLTFNDFMSPKTLTELHRKSIGTVLPRIDKNLGFYQHMIHFGCMFFYSYLTDDQITNGPIILQAKGTVCAL